MRTVRISEILTFGMIAVITYAPTHHLVGNEGLSFLLAGCAGLIVTMSLHR